MTLTRLEAVATTCRVDPGREAEEAGRLHVRGRVFTDRVESADARLDGTNRVTLDLDVNPADGTGTLEGTFDLVLTSGAATWKGAVGGRFEGGMVVADGIARGSGPLEGAVLHIEYRQIPQHPGKPPCAEPLAFLTIRALILPRA